MQSRPRYHECCFHVHKRRLPMPLPKGHVLLICCKCGVYKTEHESEAYAEFEEVVGDPSSVGKPLQRLA